MKRNAAFLLFAGLLLWAAACPHAQRVAAQRPLPAESAIRKADDALQPPLELKLTVPASAQPGMPPDAHLTLTNNSDKPLRAGVEFSIQHNAALFDAAPPNPIYGSDRAQGTKSWTEAEGKVIEKGSLTDGKPWTSAETDYIKDHFTEAFQYIDLGQAHKILRLTWDAGDANWVAKVDVSGSMDGQTYTPIPSLQNVDLYKKWGTHVFPLDRLFEARYLRFRYHNNGVKATVIRMPTAIGVYTGIAGESTEIPALGHHVATGKFTTDVPPHGSSTLPLTGREALTPGAYLVAAKVQAEGGGRTYLSWQNLMVMPKPLTATANSRFGINGSDAAATSNLQKLGVGWVRFENLKWPFVSAEKGSFHFDGSLAPWHVNDDALFASYRDNNLNILPFLFLTQDYETPPGTAPPSNKLTMPPKDFAGYAEFVYQAVARYGSTRHPEGDLKTPDKKSGLGLVHVYELWNEPNLNNPDWGSWKGPLNQYYQMFRLGAEAAKKADPTARVSNAGFSGIGVPLVDGLRTYKYADGKCPLDFMDVLNVHYYTGQSPPELCRINANTGTFGSLNSRTFEENLVLLRDWRDHNKPGMPIWLTETGYETNGTYGVDERTQAAWLPRDVLLCLANGMEKVMVFRESGSDPDRWGSAGVLRTDGSQKPSFFSYATLIREMNGITGGALRVATQDNIRIYAWKQGDQVLFTAWTMEGAAAFPLHLGSATVTDAFGDRQASVNTTELKLSIFPVYIRGCSDTVTLKAVLAKATHEETQRREALQQARSLKAYLFGFGSADDVGGFVIGDYRKSTPVLAQQTYDDVKGYGFAPTAALQNDDTRRNDPYNQHSCRLSKGMQFRFRAVPGKYVLHLGIVPFETTEQLTVRGAVAGPQQIAVTKEQGEAQIEVQVTGEPLSVEMDGYAALRWLTLVQQKPTEK